MFFPLLASFFFLAFSPFRALCLAWTVVSFVFLLSFGCRSCFLLLGAGVLNRRAFNGSKFTRDVFSFDIVFCLDVFFDRMFSLILLIVCFVWVRFLVWLERDLFIFCSCVLGFRCRCFYVLIEVLGGYISVKEALKK